MLKWPARISVQEAARILGITDGGVRGAIGRGKIPSKLEGGRRTIQFEDLAFFGIYGTSHPLENRSPGWEQAVVRVFQTLYGEIEISKRGDPEADTEETIRIPGPK